MDLLSWIKAKKAQQTADNVQNQLNQAIAAGDQLSEVQQARVGKDGTVYTTLNDRLNGEKGQTETSLTNTNNRIDTIDAQLSESDKQTTTLLHGLNVITTDQTTPTKVTFKGRTLVNLLGKDGNCEDTTKWNLNATSSVALDSANSKYGNNALKVTIATGTYGAPFIDCNGIDSNSYYLVLADVKNGNASNISLFIDGIGANPSLGGNQLSSGTYGASYIKIKPSDIVGATKFSIHFYINGAAGQYAYGDGIRVYKIPQSFYDKIDVDPAYTGDALADKFPYVDSVHHVMNPFVKNSGKNLIPPFTSGKWSLNANAKVIDDYTLELDATATNQYSIAKIPVLPNQTYIFSVTHNAQIYMETHDKNGNVIPGSGVGYTTSGTLTKQTESNASTIWVFLNNPSVAIGTFTFTNPQLELGSTATDFEPQNESYLYVAQDADKNPISLASNNDGSVADEVYQRDNQWYRLNRFKRNMVLDGSLGWTFDADYTGFKRTKITPFNGAISASPYATKFNESIIANLGEIKDTALDGDRTTIDTTNAILYISISDNDSGWGESYTPTVGEIKAYFFGYQMNNGTFGAPYDGTGTKTWVPLGDIDNTRATTVLPTSDAPTIAEGKIDHYKLTYQLAQATEESIEVEGSLDLIDGGNQIQVGEAVIVREKITPVLNGSYYFINDTTAGAFTKYKPLTNIAIYKNGSLDEEWVLNFSDQYTNGKTKAYIDQSKYDSTAEYTITYTALDTYKLSSAENSVEVEYNTNIKTVVNALVQKQEDDETDISVLKLQMIDVIARLEAGGL